MTYSLISNGESGLSVRTTLNNIITDANNGAFTGATGANGTSGTSGISPTGGPSTAFIQTTDSATASIATLAMGTYSVYSIEAVISAYDSTGDLGYGSQLFATFKNVGGTVSQVSTTDLYEKSDLQTATSHIIVDTHPKIIVIGEDSKTIDWTVNYTITKI